MTSFKIYFSQVVCNVLYCMYFHSVGNAVGRSCCVLNLHCVHEVVHLTVPIKLLCSLII